MSENKSPDEIEKIGEKVIAAAIQVHRSLGPGLLESTYRTCLCAELSHMNLKFEREVWLSIEYRTIRIERAYRLDLLVEKCVIVELKNVDELKPVHISQLLTYLRMGGRWLGLLINFNVPVLYKGVKRVLNGYRNEPHPVQGNHRDIDTLEVPS